MNKNAGLILAAGLSSRMGVFKPLLKIGDKTFIEHIINKFRLVGLSPIVIVGGYNLELLKEKLKGEDLIFLNNDLYEKTDMFYSLKLGIEFLQEKCDGVLMTPCDNPLFKLSTVKTLLDYKDKIVIPINKTQGHPIFIKKEAFTELLNFKGEEGLKSFLEKVEYKKYAIVDDPGIDFDADYFDDYEKMLDYYNKEKNIRSIYFLRHGDIEKRDKEKIYYSSADFKLNEVGRIKLNNQIKYLRNKEISSIYTSPLSRCKIGAFDFSKVSKINNVNICNDLREIELGDWEGKSFSYIKENYNEDFIERGENINFCPKGGESLYMAYDRFSSAIEKIIKSSAGDLVIFTHKGLIQLLLGYKKDNNLLKAWDYSIPPGSITRFDLVDSKLNLIYYGFLPVDYPSDIEIKNIYKDLDLDQKIIRHMVSVMNISNILSNHLEKNGYILNKNLLRSAALLHDIKRKEKNHELKAADYIRNLGYRKLSDIIKNHNNYRQLEDDKITESDILYLADKYSFEDRLVSIDERFRRSLIKCKTKEAIYFHNQRYEFAKELEEFIKLKINLDYESIYRELGENYEKFIEKNN
ncbi:histidine phosphatase family protein [Peptoniphilus catoniae]|uniref:histidine phosphatase family protein n=1 Tax=Peptoniphilus catoniae TaxID=1660341 RepID=UPI0010FE49B4|nr:histidine phosphatase family protein [Peptoniphilus catoniae]